MVIFQAPYASKWPIRHMTSIPGGPGTPQLDALRTSTQEDHISDQATIADLNVAGNDSIAGGDWSSFSPHGLVGVETTHVAEVYDPATHGNNPHCQLMGGHCDVQIAVPYDGVCASWTVSEGDSPSTIGRGQAPALIQSTFSYSGTAGERSIEAFIRTMRNDRDVSETEKARIMKHAVHRMHQGSTASASQTLTVVSAPSECWFRAGDRNDAVAASHINMSYDHFPRNNLQAASSLGLVYIKNTGSVAISVSTRAQYAFSCLFSDQAGVSKLAHQMRENAPTLTAHPPSSSTLNHRTTASQAGPASLGKHPLKTAAEATGGMLNGAYNALVSVGEKTMSPEVATNTSEVQKAATGANFLKSAAEFAWGWAKKGYKAEQEISRIEANAMPMIL